MSRAYGSIVSSLVTLIAGLNDQIAGLEQERRGKTSNQALRALANRLVGILHGYLRHQQPYAESIAWPALMNKAA